MRLHDIAFYTAIFFLIGVAAASSFLDRSYAVLIVISITVLIGVLSYVWRGLTLVIISASVGLGGMYMLLYHTSRTATDLPIGNPTTISGVVRRAAPTPAGFKIDVNNIRITLPRYPEYRYGDRISATGILEKPEDKIRLRWLKDGITATMLRPKAQFMESGQGNPFIAFLYDFKQRILNIFRAVLPRQEALFLSGITVGETSEFPREFREELSRSGTSHLVALSGYNISIIADNLALALLMIFSRRITFVVTILAILFFVLMTGAEASVVRAAFMGGLILFAGEVGRVYSFRNAIAIAAFLMVLFNPYVLLFDLGFQLSFLALLGIVYLRPLVERVCRLEGPAGFLSWRRNLSSTIAAQLAVLPLLLHTFGNVSWVGIAANVLILGFMPAAMALGAAVAGAGLLSLPLASVVGLLIHPLLFYMLATIYFFGNLAPLSAPGFPFAAMIIYYGLLAWLVVWFFSRERAKRLAHETEN